MTVPYLEYLWRVLRPKRDHENLTYKGGRPVVQVVGEPVYCIWYYPLPAVPFGLRPVGVVTVRHRRKPVPQRARDYPIFHFFRFIYPGYKNAAKQTICRTNSNAADSFRESWDVRLTTWNLVILHDVLLFVLQQVSN
jgi:hypothetical protein